MAEVKWIKIVTDIFDDEKILLIESLPEADGLIVIWFKLLCLAGKQNNSGVFLMNNKIPYTEEMLAAIFRRPLSTIKMALNTFQDFGMIEIVDGVITIPNWEKHQSLDQLELAREKTRQRVAKHRARQKEMLLGVGASEEICVYCGEKGTTIDHVIPKVNGGLDIKENVVPCCMQCNQQKNDYDLERFLNDKLIMNEKVDIERILNNEVLKNYVSFDYSTNRFVMLPVTLRNAEVTPTELDKNKNKNKNKKEDIPYEQIKDLYHSICVSLPKIIKLNDNRKKVIKQRWNEYGDIQIFETLFTKTEESSFLIGNNSNNWQANFDWILNGNHMVKILEGNYDNRAKVINNTNNGNDKASIDDLYAMLEGE